APAATGQLRKRLLVIDGADRGQPFYLPEAGVVTLGNNGKQADIVLHDLYVARVHCQVEVRGDEVFVSHLEGLHGTMGNGQRIARPRAVRVGDTLRAGNSHLRVEGVAAQDVPAGAVVRAGAAKEPDRDTLDMVEERAARRSGEAEEAPAKPPARKEPLRHPH